MTVRSELRTFRDLPAPGCDTAPPSLSALAERRIGEALGMNFNSVWRTLRRLGVPASLADDAAQQVFCVFAARLAAVEQDKERAFLIGVATRVAANFCRKQRRIREVPHGEIPEPRSPLIDPEASLIQKRRLEQLDLALGTLSDEQRAVFALYEIEGFSLPEVAALLDIKLGTATSRLARARSRFEAWVALNLGKEAP